MLGSDAHDCCRQVFLCAASLRPNMVAVVHFVNNLWTAERELNDKKANAKMCYAECQSSDEELYGISSVHCL
jgi:hypothetical protein